MAMVPYNGSLLRLALTTIGFIALLALAVAALEETVAAARQPLGGQSAPSDSDLPVVATGTKAG